jgi:hypothetical protein
MPLKVTFDTNTLNSVVWPGTAQRGTGTSGAEIQAAIKAGHITGFICGSVPSMEGVNKEDRVEFLSKQPMRPRVVKTNDPDFNLVVIAPDQSARPPLSSKFEERLKAAVQLGIRVIKIPLYTELKLPLSFIAEEPANFVEKFVRVYSAIKQRGVGRALLENLGPELAMKAGGPHMFAVGTIPDLSSYNTDEQKKIKNAVNEASDGDAVAAHFAFGNDLLCSEDFGKKGASVFDDNNRKWLNEEFGIQFVTLADLVKMAQA